MGHNMSPVVDLLASLAAIAGIFVGFGALVVLSKDSDSTVPELHMVRSEPPRDCRGHHRLRPKMAPNRQYEPTVSVG